MNKDHEYTYKIVNTHKTSNLKSSENPMHMGQNITPQTKLDTDHLRVCVPLFTFDPRKNGSQSLNRKDCLGCQWYVNVTPNASDPPANNCSVDATLLL